MTDAADIAQKLELIETHTVGAYRLDTYRLPCTDPDDEITCKALHHLGERRCIVWELRSQPGRQWGSYARFAEAHPDLVAR